MRLSFPLPGSVGSSVIYTYYAFTLLCVVASTYIYLSFWELLKLAIFYFFGRFLFKQGYKLSIKLYCTNLIRKLKKATGYKEKIRVIVLDVPIPNAFAFRSEGTFGIFGKHKKYIAVTTEIVKMSNKDELNFVLVHEFAHHYKNHIIVAAISYALSQVSLLQILLFPISLFSLLSTAVIAITAVVSRRQEKEADRLAAEFLKRAKLPCHGGITLFEKFKLLEKKKDNSILSKIIDFFTADHPALKERIRELSRLCPKK